VDESIINHIWKRAGEFFPKLKELPLEDFTLDRKVRIGLRPYSKSMYFRTCIEEKISFQGIGT